LDRPVGIQFPAHGRAMSIVAIIPSGLVMNPPASKTFAIWVVVRARKEKSYIRVIAIARLNVRLVMWLQYPNWIVGQGSSLRQILLARSILRLALLQLALLLPLFRLARRAHT